MATHMQRNSPGAARNGGGPVVLRPIRVTPCLYKWYGDSLRNALLAPGNIHQCLKTCFQLLLGSVL